MPASELPVKISSKGKNKPKAAKLASTGARPPPSRRARGFDPLATNNIGPANVSRDTARRMVTSVDIAYRPRIRIR
jgi:hypothetical protein